MAATKLGAGEGNRTLVVSLEGFCSTIELHPRFSCVFSYVFWCSKSKQYPVVEGAGFEPAYSERADLQSAAINHSATPPRKPSIIECAGVFVKSPRCRIKRFQRALNNSNRSSQNSSAPLTVQPVGSILRYRRQYVHPIARHADPSKPQNRI